MESNGMPNETEGDASVNPYDCICHPSLSLVRDHHTIKLNASTPSYSKLLLMCSLSSPHRAQGRSVMQSALSDLGIPTGALLWFL